MKNATKVLLIFLFKSESHNASMPDVTRFTSLINSEILTGYSELKDLSYVDDTNTLSSQGTSYAEYIVSENKRSSDDINTGAHRVQVNFLLKALKDRKTNELEKAIEIKDIKNTHSWKVSGSFGMAKTSWFPSASFCIACGTTYDNFKVMPHKCPRPKVTK